MPGGRPTKLNKDTLDILYKALVNGLTIRTACDMADISESTFMDWRKDHEEFRQFLATIKKERQKFAIEQIDKIRNEKQWTAAAWLLERTFHQDFGKKDTIKHEGSAENPVRIISIPSDMDIKDGDV